MKNKFKVKLYGKEYTVKLVKDSYTNNDNLALELYVINNKGETIEPFTMLSVNLIDLIFYEPIVSNKEKYFFLDDNNNDWAPKWIYNKKIAEPLGIYYRSGFCRYQLYKLTNDAYNMLCEEAGK